MYFAQQAEFKIIYITIVHYRILIGCVFVMDTLDRMTDLRQHYTDEGVSPRTLMLSKLEGPGYVRYIYFVYSSCHVN